MMNRFVKSISLVTLLFSSQVHSLSCEHIPLSKLFKDSDYVYIGYFVGKTTDESKSQTLNQMKVSSIIKGNVPEWMLVQTFYEKPIPSICKSESAPVNCYANFVYREPSFEHDKKYMVFGNYNEIPYYGLCSSNITSGDYINLKLKRLKDENLL